MRARILLCGHPNSGKTASLAELCNAGLDLKLKDFDNKHETLLPFLEKGARPPHVDTYDVALPAEFDRALRDLDALAGEPPTTVCAIDTISFAGQLAFRSALAMNRLPLGAVAVPEKVWGEAAKKLEQLTLKILSPKMTCSVIIVAHLRPAEDDRTKKQIIVPTTIGQGFSHQIVKMLPDIWHMEGRGQRRLTATPTAELPWLRSSLLKPEDFATTFNLGTLVSKIINWSDKKGD